MLDDQRADCRAGSYSGAVSGIAEPAASGIRLQHSADIRGGVKRVPVCLADDFIVTLGMVGRKQDWLNFIVAVLFFAFLALRTLSPDQKDVGRTSLENRKAVLPQ